MWSVKCEVWSLECEGSSEKWEVRSVKCGLWSAKCEVWTVNCEVSTVKCEVWGLECEGSSEKCEVRSVKFEVWTPKSAVCSVRCGVSREGHGRDRASLNYRSFMFGKLPPPACPGLCYFCYKGLVRENVDVAVCVRRMMAVLTPCVVNRVGAEGKVIPKLTMDLDEHFEQAVSISFNQFQSVSISFIVFTSNHCNHWLLVLSFVSNLYTFFILLCSLCGWQAGCTWYVIKWLADEQSRFPVSFLVLSSLTSQIKSEWKLPCLLGGIMLFGTRTVDNTSCLICCASSPSVKKATVVHLRCKLEVPVDDGKARKMLEDAGRCWKICLPFHVAVTFGTLSFIQRLSTCVFEMPCRSLIERLSTRSRPWHGRCPVLEGFLQFRESHSFALCWCLFCIAAYCSMFYDVSHLLAKIWVWSCLA